MSDIDAELGPVDYVLVAFPVGQADFSGEMASKLAALMDSNTCGRVNLAAPARGEGAASQVTWG